MHGGEPIHWFLSRTYLKQTKSFNDGSDKYFCCNTTKHNGNSANIIHTQNALQVYERKSAMSWRLIDETTLRIYMRQHFQTNYSNESYRLHMSALFFLMLRTHLQDTRLLLEFTWFYEYCVNLLNLPNRYTLSRPSTPMEGFEEVHEGTWIWRNWTYIEHSTCY